MGFVRIFRSDLVLDADHSLHFLGTQEAKEMLIVSYLALQPCISFCSVSDKSGALLLFGGHPKLGTLKPVSRVFRIFRVLVSAFSAALLRGVSSDPCFARRKGLPHFLCLGFESLYCDRP